MNINITDRQHLIAIRAVTHTNLRSWPGDIELPSLEGITLSLPSHRDVILSLIEHIEAFARRKSGLNARAALHLARKIRRVTGARETF